ncbi:MAG: thioredoxin family protein [Deltaproteobacteria bacterium]|nr:thioredoxin family protein [Deltaproteobacteria bacterium]
MSDELNIFLDEIKKTPMNLAYFSTPQCNVCKALKPKIISLIEENFSKVNFIYVDTTEKPELSGQLSIFTVPTIILFVEGRESVRLSRNLSLFELEKTISRPYGFLYSDNEN